MLLNIIAHEFHMNNSSSSSSNNSSAYAHKHSTMLPHVYSSVLFNTLLLRKHRPAAAAPTTAATSTTTITATIVISHVTAVQVWQVTVLIRFSRFKIRRFKLRRFIVLLIPRALAVWTYVFQFAAQHGSYS
jgi:hypothetical protein